MCDGPWYGFSFSVGLMGAGIDRFAHRMGMPYSLSLQFTALLIKMGSHGLLHPLAGIRLLRAGCFSLGRTSGLTFVRPGGGELRRSAPFFGLIEERRERSE
jgi:hypothetical protein